MPLHAMKHDHDPAVELLERIGKLPEKICGARILAATYVRPEQTQSGLFLPDRRRDEDLWQGKAHLVLAMGDECYRNDARRDFAGPYCKPGDWIVIVPNAGRMVEWNGVPCRIIDDVDVEMVIDAPDAAY